MFYHTRGKVIYWRPLFYNIDDLLISLELLADDFSEFFFYKNSTKAFQLSSYLPHSTSPKGKVNGQRAQKAIYQGVFKLDRKRGQKSQTSNESTTLYKSRLNYPTNTETRNFLNWPVSTSERLSNRKQRNFRSLLFVSVAEQCG